MVVSDVYARRDFEAIPADFRCWDDILLCGSHESLAVLLATARVPPSALILLVAYGYQRFQLSKAYDVAQQSGHVLLPIVFEDARVTVGPRLTSSVCPQCLDYRRSQKSSDPSGQTMIDDARDSGDLTGASVAYPPWAHVQVASILKMMLCRKTVPPSMKLVSIDIHSGFLNEEEFVPPHGCQRCGY